MTKATEGLPSHASPIISPLPRPSAQYFAGWSDLESSSRPGTPGIPQNLISPAFTPPLTPNIPGTPSGHSYHHEPKSIAVDTSLDDPTTFKQPKLLERLPEVECVVRARIPTTSGAEMFLHLYQNDVDNKEHLAIVFGNSIRSRSLDAERPGETEMDRMIRGAYTGRLRPGRTSSRRDDEQDLRRKVLRQTDTSKHKRSGSALKNVENVTDNSAQKQSENTSSTDDTAERIQNFSIDQRPQEASTQVVNTQAQEHQHTPQLHLPLVRIHSECYTGETAWSARCDCGEQLDEAARLMSMPSSITNPSLTTNFTTTSTTNSHPPSTDLESNLSEVAGPGGVIVYLRQEGRGIGLASKLKAYNLQDLGNDTVEANLLLRHPADARSYGLATAILVDLGLGTDTDVDGSESTGPRRGIRLLTNNPDKVRAVEGPNREVRVVERVAMVPIAWRTGGSRGVKGVEIEKYLETKIGRMGHMIHE